MALPTNITPGARVLIIDDDADCAFGLARMLKKTGYTAVRAMTDPTVALERFPKLKCDIVLLDLTMEQLPGIEVLKRINEITEPRSRPAVVILTGDTTMEAKHEALAAGATAFLMKPVDLIEVILRIENLLTTRDLYQRCQLYSEGLERLLDRRTAELQTADLEKAIAGLRDTQQQVIQQERMRALDTMAAGIAHDLNNGLSIILGYGQMLLTDSNSFPAESEAREKLEKIMMAGTDNATLVKRLSAFHRPSDTLENLEPVDLNQMIEEALSLTTSRWQRQDANSNATISIEKDLRKIPVIAGVAAELREVLTNLIFNAVDAMAAGGRLRFRTRGEIGRVRLEISDTGIGMTPETVHKCFEPFFSTKGEGGSGLGLAMSYGIIRRHDGTITIESRLNKGTILTILLPISKEALLQVNPPRLRRARTRARPKRLGPSGQQRVRQQKLG